MKIVLVVFTPFPAFPHRWKELFARLFPLGGNGKGG